MIADEALRESDKYQENVLKKSQHLVIVKWIAPSMI